MKKIKVAFICVHNACRSQIAEALGKKYASDVFESYSAGTEKQNTISKEAVDMMKIYHDVDMSKEQYSKLLLDIPNVDIVVTMGCNVSCPSLPCRHREDWGIQDPTGQNQAVFKETIDRIYEKVLDLKRRIIKGEISL